MFDHYLFLIASFYISIHSCFAKSENENSFQLVVYNVENLFDVDGISLYNDYKPEMYGRKELEKKLDKICDVLKKIGGNTGPDIILFQEIEVDRTPDKFLSATEELLKELELNGLGPYYFSLGYNTLDSPEKWPAVHCLTVSKFPISKKRLHPLNNARPILETTVTINNKPLTLFNNHWKSGASSQKMEVFRLQNAEVLRNRITSLSQENPSTDFIVGGDLNSHYNQSTVYQSEMNKTGINDILLSNAIEPGPENIGETLYNLWHEIPPEKRGSDAWKGKWGTLMHILLPASLYDAQGINYITDSFRVENHAGLNEIEGLNIPFKWSNELNGFGASDHFPLSARFKISNERTEKGKHFRQVESEARKIDYNQASMSAQPWKNSYLKPKNFGRTYEFTGIITKQKPLTLRLDQREFGIYSHDPDTRDFLFSRKVGESITTSGYLSRYRGQWQFIIAEKNWIK